MRNHPFFLKVFVTSMLALLVLMSGPTVIISASKASCAHNLTHLDPPVDQAASASTLLDTDTTTRSKVVEAFARLPLSFEANQGQTNPRVKFLSRGSGHTLFLTDRESVLVLNAPPSNNSPVYQKSRTVKQRCAAVRMKLAGINTMTKL